MYQMKNKVLKKALSFLLAAVFLVACLPSLADALPYDLKIDDKGTINNETEKTPAQLNDGELYTYTSVTAAELPSTDFSVSMSALGQQYTKLVTSTQRFNIVFVLDVSGSMGSSNKLTNMVNAANAAFATLNVNDNKIGVVTFSYTPAVERNLSTKPVRLSQIYSTSYSGSTDNIYVRANGGTNIQGGFNAAFKMLDEENDPEAIPVIILLSDGAPTYYYSNITGLKTTSDYSGNGSDTGTNEVGYSIMQAAYLKTQMENLQIYTIPFSIDSNDYKAAATLNPTSANINQVSGLSSKITSIKNSLTSSVRNQIVTNYPNGSYSASNSTSSLGQAMSSIITNLQYSKPIAEKTVSGVLSESSFITMTYNIGTAYQLSGDTLQVTLAGSDYPFTRHGFVFTYDVPDYQASYNESMTRVSIELDGNALIWQVPAGVLPCNTPEGADQVLASPIRLTFTLAFNDSLEGLTAGTYPINSSCTASFYPTPDNPYYYQKSDTVTQTIAENTYTTGTERVYFAATYPYPGHDNYGKSGYGLPTLTGFATGSSSGSVSFMANPQNVTVKDYYDHNNDSKDILTVLYQQQEVAIEDVGIRTAHVSLTTTNTGSPAAYQITSFDDGEDSFSDASVTGVSSAGYGKYDIVVSYDGGKRNVTFEDVSVSQTNIYETAYATFFSSRYDE